MDKENQINPKANTRQDTIHQTVHKRHEIVPWENGLFSKWQAEDAQAQREMWTPRHVLTQNMFVQKKAKAGVLRNEKLF